MQRLVHVCLISHWLRFIMGTVCRTHTKKKAYFYKYVNMATEELANHNYTFGLLIYKLIRTKIASEFFFSYNRAKPSFQAILLTMLKITLS